MVWRGDTPIAGSAAAIEQLRAAGWRVVFTTNNSSLRIADYVQRLARFDIPADPEDVCTSAQAAAALVAAGAGPGAPVFASAGPGVVEALVAHGLRVVSSGPVEAVVVGFHRDFDFDGLTRASDAARGGARYRRHQPRSDVSRSTVASCPAPARSRPRCRRRPAVIPKSRASPTLPMAELVRSRYGRAGVVVGDRPSTDGAFAAALGWPFALVLVGRGRKRRG